MRKSLLLLALALLGTPASAQLRRPPPAPPVPVIDVLRADFAAQSGGTTVYFSGDSVTLSPQGRTILAAQALWLRRHPALVVRIEGHADPSDTRDHAIAIGARRAERLIAGVRELLALQSSDWAFLVRERFWV